MDKRSLFAHKEMSFFASVIIKIGAKFCSFDCQVLCYILRINCSQLTQRKTWDFALRGREVTIYWHIIVV